MRRHCTIAALASVFAWVPYSLSAQSEHSAGVQECLKQTDPAKMKQCVSDLAALVAVLRRRITLSSEVVENCRKRETVQAIRACLDPGKGRRVWEMSREVSKMDGSATVMLILEAEDEIDLGNQRDRPALLVRCMEGETNVFVLARWTMDDVVEVQWRMDSEKPDTGRWKSSTDRNAVGLWTSRPAIAFAKELMTKSSMVFRVTPQSSGRQEVVFNVAGLDQAIGPLRAACKW